MYKFFFAGKIKGDTSALKTRLFVGYDNFDLYSYLTSAKYGDIEPREISRSQIADFDDYKVSYAEAFPNDVRKDGYILTGPIGIVNGLDVSHGCWNTCGVLFVYGLEFERHVSLVNRRNMEALRKAQVVSLEIDERTPSCFQSLSEWGMAVALKKICVIYFTDEVPGKVRREFRTHIRQSLESFDGIPKNERDKVISAHPMIPMRTFDEYKKHILYAQSGGYDIEIPSYDDVREWIEDDNISWMKKRRRKAIFWEWRRVACEAAHHPERKRARGEFEIAEELGD